jgi:hypothetical protein
VLGLIVVAVGLPTVVVEKSCEAVIATRTL